MLTHLPLELILHILYLLSEDDGEEGNRGMDRWERRRAHSLKSVSLTSHILRYPAQSILFESVQLCPPTPCANLTLVKSQGGLSNPARGLNEMLHTSPHLRSYIKHLCLIEGRKENHSLWLSSSAMSGCSDALERLLPQLHGLQRVTFSVQIGMQSFMNATGEWSFLDVGKACSMQKRRTQVKGSGDRIHIISDGSLGLPSELHQARRRWLTVKFDLDIVRALVRQCVKIPAMQTVFGGTDACVRWNGPGDISYFMDEVLCGMDVKPREVVFKNFVNGDFVSSPFNNTKNHLLEEIRHVTLDLCTCQSSALQELCSFTTGVIPFMRKLERITLLICADHARPLAAYPSHIFFTKASMNFLDDVLANRDVRVLVKARVPLKQKDKNAEERCAWKDDRIKDWLPVLYQSGRADVIVEREGTKEHFEAC